MVVKVYISGISGNKEVKKRQQRVLMILDSKNIKYEIIDITEPGREDDKDFMQNNSKSNGGTVSDPNPRSPLPPQLFNDDEYCGDYDQFDLANEVDTLEQFLKVEVPPEISPAQEKTNAVNGVIQQNEDQNGSKDEEQIVNLTAESTTQPADAEADNSSHDVAEENSVENKTIDKEPSPVRQQSQEKPVEETENESKVISKENTPVKDDGVNENGATASREQSAEKEQVNEKDHLSEALIESEKMAASD
ncbi:Sh3beta isoform E [Danaus plexippus plexippus]|uniref:Sh3beta isoform E n=1 Tax=Danaus plexippus plexippus TaxID=278856 RepID=A0A212F0H4_DANPL|nr:Sh3beta isoform E [Danaus plexippus plexippus]